MKRIFLNYYLFVILVLVLAKFVAFPLIEYFAAAPFKQQFTQYYRELTKGTFFVVSQYLQIAPQQDWQERLQSLQPQFGYPISLVELSTDLLPEGELNQLKEGQIVVGSSYDQFWWRIGLSDYALVMGPFPSPGVGNAVSFFTWSIVLVLLGVVVIIWALPFWRKLSQISKTAAVFGEGNFAIRAKIPRQSALAPLASTFNQMADRIQHLITAQKELTNAVSHELRTPIARLRFGMEMFETSLDPVKKAHYVKGVHRDINEMDSLVSELLTYSRFDSNHIDLHIEKQAIAPWLKKVMQGLAAEISAQLQHDSLVSDDAVIARFDSRLLRRAIGNLVQNGSKYGNGHVKVILEQQGSDFLIHVDDDGPGIQETERERVFEPFSRLDSSRSRESGGYGLGLAIVKQAINAHQGSVNISASECGGSRFTIRLPG